jgi:hypothetical protein
VNDALMTPRAPRGRAAWDGWFFIAVFPNGEWCKIHLFSGGKSPRKHCLSAVESLDGGPQELTLVGRADGIDRRGGAIGPVHGTRGAEVAFDGPIVRGHGVEARADVDDPFFWIRVPRVLSYFSATGAARVTAGGRGRDAFALLEHAWGAETRLDVARLAPRRWQWDVLSLGDGRFFAGLAFHGFGPRGSARLTSRGGLDKVNTVHISAGAPGRAWSGTLRARSATLRYEARAATPVASEVDGGGFVGFTWEGELDGKPAQGAGFSEFRAAS